MDLTTLLTALTAGMIAAFNPCGFALLPAYLALFLGDARDAGTAAAVRRALLVGAAVTVGFIAVFGVAGVLISTFAVQVSAWTPYATLVVGPLLALLGVWLLTGHELSLRLPRLHRSVDTGPGGMVLYGVIYATVSLSCTIPVFLVAVVGTFRAESWVAGVAVLLAYAVGMGLVLTALAVAMALAREGIVGRSRGLMAYVSRVSGGLLVVAGLYITWYGYVEIRVLAGDQIGRGPVDTVTSWSASISTWVDGVGGGRLAVAALAVVVLGLVLARLRRRPTRGNSPVPEPSTPTPELSGGARAYTRKAPDNPREPTAGTLEKENL